MEGLQAGISLAGKTIGDRRAWPAPSQPFATRSCGHGVLSRIWFNFSNFEYVVRAHLRARTLCFAARKIYDAIPAFRRVRSQVFLCP
jgi:hypothetical protein